MKLNCDLSGKIFIAMDLKIDEYGFSMAKSLFEDKLMMGEMMYSILLLA